MRRTLHALRNQARPLLQPARMLATQAATHAAPSATPTSRLILGLLLGGGGVLGAQMLLSSPNAHAAAADVASPSPSSSSPAPPPAKLHHVSDMASIDFRTLGACDCPPLPERAPKWLRDLATDPRFQYRDVLRLLDTRGHFLFDALSGDRRLSEAYYFSEQVQQPCAAHGGEKHPHLAPSLTFAPATAKVARPAGETKQSRGNLPGSPDSNVMDAAMDEASPAARAAADGTAARSPTPVAATSPTLPAAFSKFDTSPPLPLLSATGPEVRCVFFVGPALCGHRGIVHGGLTAALMDDVSGAATFVAAGGGHFTANLTINYIKPVPAGRYLMVRAQAVKQEGRKTYVNISVEDGVGGVFARGTALYVKPKMLPPAVLLASTQ